MESAGARVVPLFFNASATETQSALSRLNGVLFTGGGSDLSPGNPFFDTLRTVYSYAVAANAAGDYFPLWGTCMGFEAIAILAAGVNTSVLDCNYGAPRLGPDFAPRPTREERRRREPAPAARAHAARSVVAHAGRCSR